MSGTLMTGPSAAPDATVIDDSRPNAETKLAELSSPNTVEPKGPVALKLMQSTETMMEELMEELISFQERFGPGAKARNKDRARVVSGTVSVQA